MNLKSIIICSLFLFSSLGHANTCNDINKAINHKKLQYQFAIEDLQNWQELARESRITNERAALLMKVSTGLISGTLTLATLMAPPIASLTLQFGVVGYIYSDTSTLDKTEEEIYKELNEQYSLVSAEFEEQHVKLDQKLQQINFNIGWIKNAIQLGRPVAEMIQKRFEISVERAFLLDAEIKYLKAINKCSGVEQ